MTHLKDMTFRRRYLAHQLAVAGATLLLMSSPLLGTPVSWLPPATGSAADATVAKPDDGFLMSMDFNSPASATSVVGSGRIAFPSESDAPALVPLPPPAWAGLGVLGVLAYSRHRHQRRTRIA